MTTTPINDKLNKVAATEGYCLTKWTAGCGEPYRGTDEIYLSIATPNPYREITTEEHERLKELYGEEVDAPEADALSEQLVAEVM